MHKKKKKKKKLDNKFKMSRTHEKYHRVPNIHQLSQISLNILLLRNKTNKKVMQNEII